MLVYERIEPEGRCVSPDGHDYVEDITLESPIPRSCVCPRCGKDWTIATFDDSERGA